MKNFFENQAHSRSKTRKLIFLFALAILALSVSSYLVIIGVMHYQQKVSFWNPKLFGIIFMCTTGLVVVESLIRIHALKKGGGSVATLLGGKKLDAANLSVDEARLKNVVDEMSIASGTTPPEIYVLKNEKSINAFVAGFTSHDAALAVTQGSLDLLNREELQAVIAHEFSHLFNGDMKLNIKLIGYLNGILFLSEVGYMILRSKSTGRKRGGAVIAIGLGFLALGYLGYFFARLIQAAVSREREYLADASAVQYTRNPDGLSGALKKIANLSYGSLLHHPSASTIAHLTFSPSFTKNFNGLFATHPPIAERIKRLDPAFKPDFPEATQSDQLYVGLPEHSHLALAQNFISSIPLDLVKAATGKNESQAVILCLFLDSSKSIRENQLNIVDQNLKLSSECSRYYPTILDLEKNGRLPIFDYFVPNLKKLSPNEMRGFVATVIAVVKCDGHISLTEWVYIKLLKMYLHPPEQTHRKEVRHTTLHKIMDDIRFLFSAMVHLSIDENRKNAQFNAGLSCVTTQPLEILPSTAISSQALEKVISSLEFASLTLKRDILNGLAKCIEQKNSRQIEQYEFLRAIAACLGCPMPPKM